MRRLEHHVLVEFIRALALAAGVFTGFMLLITALRLEREAKTYGTSVGTLAGALPYFVPYMLLFSVPMAFLVAAVLTFGRLESSGEISAMRAAGVRLTTVLAPVLMATFLAVAALVFLADSGVEWGFSRTYERMKASGRATLASRARVGATFATEASARSFRIHRFARGDDGAAPVAIVEFREGRAGEVVLARDHEIDMGTRAAADKEMDVLRFRLGQGKGPGPTGWARIVRPGEVLLAREGEFTLALESPTERRGQFINREYAAGLSGCVRRASELRESLARTQDADGRAARRLRLFEMEFHRKLSMAFSPLALLLLGVPIGLRMGRGSRLAGFSAGIAVLAFVYYPLWVSGQGIAASGALPAAPAVWAAPVIAGAGGAAWLSRMV